MTDDLYKMFWEKLESKGECIETKQITCEWTVHPNQRHMIITEVGEGIHKYKFFYGVKQPIRFQATGGKLIDEIERFKHFRKPKVNQSKKGLKILIVGELSYNAERLYALEERGHHLYGLWIDNSHGYNTIGSLPFGNIEDIFLDNWQQQVEEIQPDIIYAVLNYRAVPLAHTVLTSNLGIPFVWHFKENAFYCRQLGTWPQLIDLYTQSDGQIYTNTEVRDWFQQFTQKEKNASSFILDGDIPSKKWFGQERSPLLSERDGEAHTVAPGRLIGLQPDILEELAAQKIHLHFYGNYYHTMYPEWINQENELASGYLHIHEDCRQEHWVKEFSQYDAGWLHYFESTNYGELMRASWNDFNYPSRMATLAAAGVPMLQRDNTGHIVATQSLTQKLDIGIFFNDFEGLGQKLRDKLRMNQLRENVWNNRDFFSFDYHVDDLINFFEDTIKRKNQQAYKSCV